MKNLLCVAFCLLTHLLCAQTDTLQTSVLSPTQLQEDFRYLRHLLQETHPGLYRYTPKPVMQAKLDSVAGLLGQPMRFYTYFNLISKLIADVRCAHTFALPLRQWESFFTTQIKTLPFFMFPIENKSYVLFNCTADSRIKPGFELVSINGKSMEQIRQTLYQHHWDDGYIQTSKQVTMQGQLFALFYYLFCEQPDTFRLVFRDLTGELVTIETAASPYKDWIQYLKKNPVNKQMNAWYNRKRKKNSWRLTFLNDVPSTGYLRIDSFGGEGARNSDDAKVKFQAYMDKFMATLAKKKTQHLIVDVRDNNGGWDVQGSELLTYLMKSDSAVQYYRRQHTITDSSEFLKYSDLSENDLKNLKKELRPETDGTFTLIDENGKDFSKEMPKPNRFRGKVYILMNGRSFSTTSEFTAVAHSNQVGTFIGEESGGAYDGGNGASFIHLSLPHSKIYIGTPLVYYQNNVKPLQKGRGTLPDYSVSITVNDVLTHQDPTLVLVKKLISKGKP